METKTAAAELLSCNAYPLSVAYLDSSGFGGACGELAAQTLGVVAFGAGRPFSLDPHCPFGRVAAPHMGAGPVYEVWKADQPVIYEEFDGFSSARSDEILFGSLEVAETPVAGIESQTYDAYLRLFDVIDNMGYGNLLRIWNYVPDINGQSEGLERYRRFNLGRHEAFMARRRGIETSPAACAVGAQGGPISIFFMASRGAARPVENPRQVSAYRYPAQYGPRSPVFSRGMLGSLGGRTVLFISGTSSVVGHESVHPADPDAQTRETILNIEALLVEARKQGFLLQPDGLHLKVYVRRPQDFHIVRDRIARSFDPQTTIAYIHADICRSELLLEVEGIGVGF